MNAVEARALLVMQIGSILERRNEETKEFYETYSFQKGRFVWFNHGEGIWEHCEEDDALFTEDVGCVYKRTNGF